MTRSTPPAWQLASLIACAVALTTLVIHALPLGPSDFSLIWAATRTSGDPYALGVLPGWPVPLLYPWTAVLVSMPLGMLPMGLATAVFTGVGAGLFAYAILLRWPQPSPAWVVFISAPFMVAVMLAQWSPILVAAVLLPWAGLFLACKPTAAIWLWIWQPSRRSLLAAVALGTVSLLIRPSWVSSWLTATGAADFLVAPITLPGGWLLLALLPFLRDPGCRLLLAMSCVPHTAMVYEALPLMLLATSWREASLICGLSWVAQVGHWWMGPYESQSSYVRVAALWTFACIYLPVATFSLARNLRR